jgi:hypothetical protein
MGQISNTKKLRASMDKMILRRIDGLCAATSTTRVDVLCALIRAVAGDYVRVVPAVFAAPRISPQERIMRVMRRDSCATIRELKRNTASKNTPWSEWDSALQGLAEAGDLHITYERTASGKTRKVVRITPTE